MKSSRNREITLLISDIGKLCLSREFLTSQVCLLTLFAKIKFSRKFQDLRYLCSFPILIIDKVLLCFSTGPEGVQGVPMNPGARLNPLSVPSF